MDWFTPARRRWLYDIGTAVAAGLGTWGVLGDAKVASINYLLAAVFNIARRNVNDEPDAEQE